MSRFVRLGVITSVFGAIVAMVACDAPDEPALTSTCSSNAGCPVGSVCNTSTGACIGDDNLVAGRFSCTLQASGAVSDEISSTSDVGGKIGGAAIFVNARAVCTDQGDHVDVVLSNPFDARPGTLTLTVPKDAPSGQDLMAAVAPDSPSTFVPVLASGRSTEGALGSGARPLIGLAMSGTLRLDSAIPSGDAGAMLGGVLLVRFKAPPAMPLPIGEPCTADGECGATPVDATFCSRPSPTKSGICTQKCSFATDCKISGGFVARCLETGLCGRGCALDAECGMGQRCDTKSTPARCVIK